MTITSITRRSTLALCGSLLFSAAGARAAFSAQGGERKLVVVILRGALDGLAAVAPYGDAHYARLRGGLALGAPGSAGGVLPIGDGFGFHPRLAFLHAAYLAKELSLLHAAATPYRERSHFDAQDVLESGAGAVFAASDGWLNRALALTPTRAGLAIASSIPLILRGAAAASNYAPSIAPAASEDTLARLMDLYADDTLLGPALAAAMATAETVGDAGIANSDAKPSGSRRRSEANWPALATTAASLIAAPDGPAAGVLEFDGWDTHANQGGADGLLANKLGALDASLKSLKMGLQSIWGRTVVIVATEFGRTVAGNGTRGTDHGTGGVAFVLGGAVAGGRLLGDWPGLAPAALYQGRDLQPANDLRALFMAVLEDHWGLDRATLTARVFPGASGLPARSAVIRP